MVLWVSDGDGAVFVGAGLGCVRRGKGIAVPV